eukprot:gene10267-13026_t
MLKKVRDEWDYGTATELKEQSKGSGVFRLVPEKRPDIWTSAVK